MRFKNETLNFLICVQIRHKVISVKNSLSAQPLHCLNTNMKTEGVGRAGLVSVPISPIQAGD